jgi:FAD/FMN-containing dehydrogenase
LAGLQQLRGAIEAERGYLLIERAPPPLMDPMGPWGELGGEAGLMRVLRQQMDPNNVLNAGRYL